MRSLLRLRANGWQPVAPRPWLPSWPGNAGLLIGSARCWRPLTPTYSDCARSQPVRMLETGSLSPVLRQELGWVAGLAWAPALTFTSAVWMSPLAALR
jgi:hypothetical protein